jgi:hypothetical protein
VWKDIEEGEGPRNDVTEKACKAKMNMTEAWI